MSLLGAMQDVAEGGVAAALAGPAGVDATLTIPGAAGVQVRAAIFRDDAHGSIQRMGAVIVLDKATVPAVPVPGSTVAANGVTWIGRDLLEQTATYRLRAARQ